MIPTIGFSQFTFKPLETNGSSVIGVIIDKQVSEDGESGYIKMIVCADSLVELKNNLYRKGIDVPEYEKLVSKKVIHINFLSPLPLSKIKYLRNVYVKHNNEWVRVYCFDNNSNFSIINNLQGGNKINIDLITGFEFKETL